MAGPAGPGATLMIMGPISPSGHASIYILNFNQLEFTYIEFHFEPEYRTINEKVSNGL